MVLKISLKYEESFGKILKLFRIFVLFLDDYVFRKHYYILETKSIFTSSDFPFNLERAPASIYIYIQAQRRAMMDRLKHPNDNKRTPGQKRL